MTISEALKSDSSNSESSNLEYWVSDEENLFVKAKLLNTITKDKKYEVEIASPNSSTTTVKTVDSIIPSNAAYFDNVENLSQLPNLNEPSVLNNLEHRFKNGKIYTYSGLFLVAVNPYKHDSSLYTSSVIQKYHTNNSKTNFSHSSSRYSVNKSSDDALPPHVFAIAEEALHNLFTQNKDQSILVTGESGAGKTENTKKILQYLTNVIQHDHSKNETGINFEDKILESNPILESFGNATTIKNNNSSRFGKFIKIFFNLESKSIERTFIDWYLLEKSRVTFIDAANERNYHIFYQLLKGIGDNPKDDLFKDLHIDSVDYNKWQFLKTNKVENSIDDLEEFKNLLTAFGKIGFTAIEQNNIFKILSAILHLGNIAFYNNSSKNNLDKQALLSDEDHKHLAIVAELLGIENIKEFEMSLISPKVTAGKEKVKQKRTCKQSKAIIDSLAKIVYEKLFSYIVSKINDSLQHNSQSGSSESSSGNNFIGLLDIAGFEIFDKNSLEQLLINYTNENLQQFFNHHMFILEQEEYMKEQIMWNFKDYGQDLQHTIDLLSLKPKGILPLLDEETIMPNSTDAKFYDRLLTTVSSNSRFQRVKTSQNNKLQTTKHLNNFIIKHYAGDVEYNSSDWLHKNKEPLSEHLQELLFSSKNELLQNHLFANKQLNNSFKTQSQRHCYQLFSLISNLKNANPHFIRCILPNRSKSPSIFDKQLVLDQLMCNGVLEGIRISREGFPNRITFETFAKTYAILLDDGKNKNGLGNKEWTQAIVKSIKELSSSNEDFKIGKTKILFKSGKLAILEELKQSKLNEIIGCFISKIKGNKLRSNMQRELKKMNAAKILSDAFTLYDEKLMKNGWFKLFTSVKPLIGDDDSKHNSNTKNKKLADIISKNQELIDMVNSLEVKLETVKESSKKISEINLKLEEDISTSQNEKAILTDKISKLNNSLNEKIGTKDEEIKKLNETHQSFESKIQELTTCKETLNSSEIELNSNIESLQIQKTTIAKELAAKTEKLTSEIYHVKSLETTKIDLESQIKALQNQIKAKDEEIDALQSKLKNSDSQIDSKLTILEKNFNDANNRVKLLVDENQIARSELSKLKQEKLKLERETSSSVGLLSKSALEIKHLDREVKELQQFKKINVEQQEDKHKQQVSELLSKQKALETEFTDLQIKYHSVESALRESKLQFNNSKSSLKDENVTGLKMEIKALQTQLYNEKLDNDYIHQKTLSVCSNREAYNKNPELTVAELMDLKEILKREQKEKNNFQSRIKFLRTKLAGANMDNEELSHKVLRLTAALHENRISLEDVGDGNQTYNDDISLIRNKLKNAAMEYDKMKEQLDMQVALKEQSEQKRQLLMQKLGSIMTEGNLKQTSRSIDFNNNSLSNPNSKELISLKSHLVDLKDSLDLTSMDLLKAEQKIIHMKQNESGLNMTIISLNKDLEATNKQNNLYSQSISEYKEDYQQLSEETLVFEEKLKQSQLKLNQQHEKLFQMEKLLEEHATELTSLNKEKLSREDFIIDLEDSLSSKEIELEKMEQLNQLLKEDVKHMKGTLNDFSRDSDLISKIEALNGKLSKMSRNEIELNKQISNLEYDLENLEKEYEFKLMESNKQNEHYLVQNKELLSLNQSFKKQISELTEASTVNNNEINKLNEIIDSNIIERNSLIKERDSLMDSLDMKDSKIENYISEMTTLKNSNEEIMEMFDLKNNSLKRHETLINKLNEENVQLQESLDQLKEDLIDLEKENGGLGHQNNELNEHIKDMSLQLKGRSVERDSWNGKLSEMNMKLSKETENKFEQVKEKKKLINELDEVNVQLDNCLSKLESVDKENHYLAQNLQSKEVLLKNISDELSDEKSKIKRHQSNNESLEKKLSSMEQEIELWKSRYYSKVRE